MIEPNDLAKVIYDGPDEPQPDWRDEDPDDGLDDNDDDPAPFSDQLLADMLGIGADE